MANVNGKSLAAAIGLNLVLPGAGYVYLGRVILGIAAFLLILGMALTSPLIIWIPVWFGMNLVMAIDMVILFNKAKAADESATTYPCPHCAELIQRAASICRFCKSPLTPRDDSPATGIGTQAATSGGSAMRVVLTGLVAFFVIVGTSVYVFNQFNLLQTSGVFSNDSPASTNSPAIEVSSTELMSSYLTNEVAADQRFKGQIINVSGRVSKIGKDFLDNAYVTLDTADMIRELQCGLARSGVAAATKLSPGNLVTMRGKVRGLMGNVQIEDCTIVPPNVAPARAADSRPKPVPNVRATKSLNDLWHLGDEYPCVETDGQRLDRTPSLQSSIRTLLADQWASFDEYLQEATSCGKAELIGEYMAFEAFESHVGPNAALQIFNAAGNEVHVFWLEPFSDKKEATGTLVSSVAPSDAIIKAVENAFEPWDEFAAVVHAATDEREGRFFTTFLVKDK